MTTLTVQTLNGTYIVRHAADVPGGPATIKHLPNDPTRDPSRTGEAFVNVDSFTIGKVGLGGHVVLRTGPSSCAGVDRLTTSVIRHLDIDGITIPVGVARLGD